MMPNPEPLILVEHLTLGFAGRAVLRDVTLRFGAGEFWFLLGPNGRGKTTLLRSMLGQLEPGAGTVKFGGEMDGLRSIGYVPQRAAINPSVPITVAEFVELGTVGLRFGRVERARNLAWSLENVGLADFGGRDYWSLSGGQRQRALVARALVRRPRLVILDEPTNGLDYPTEQALLRALAGMNRDEGLTIVFVTHDLAKAFQFGSHFALFHDGTVTGGVGVESVSDALLAATFGARLRLRRTDHGDVHLSVSEEAS